MPIAVIAAVGGVVQVVRALVEYHQLHGRNKGLLDILEGFSQNLQVSIERLMVREELLTGSQNDSLESIAHDFQHAETWLRANDKNLRSIWTVIQASDQLHDLDMRLMKSFASKISVAIFSALQDSRQATTKIQSTLEGMQESMEVAVREASRMGLKEAIKVLKEEAFQARGGGGETSGFRNGEAEKIISQLVDQLSAQDALREEEEALGIGRSDPTSHPPYDSPASLYAASFSASSINRPSSTGSSQRDSMFERGTNGGSVTSAGSRESGKGKGKARRSDLPPGSIVFMPLDPVTNEDIIDPVLANDGLIHDRWNLVTGIHPNARDPAEPLFIVGDVVQLREAIFKSFPARRASYETKRQAYREETIRLYDEAGHDALPDILYRLSHILHWEPTSVPLRIRRGLARYRLRDLAGAHEDLTHAILLSTRDLDGTPDQHDPDLDALRARALVREEMHDHKAAMEDITTVLRRSPRDVLALSLRASIRGNAGNLRGAQADLSSTNVAISSQTAYQSSIGQADVDLEYLARGWAYISLGDFASASADFDYSLNMSARPTREPYTLASRGVARVNAGLIAADDKLVADGLADLDTAIDIVKLFATIHCSANQPIRQTSGIPTVSIGADGLPVHAFGIYFLRGMAYFARKLFPEALADILQGIRLRPSDVCDTGEFRHALAQLKAETGDTIGALADFDYAVALKPEERFVYTSTRESYGL